MTPPAETGPAGYNASSLLTFNTLSMLALILGGYYAYLTFFKKSVSWEKYGIVPANIGWMPTIILRDNMKKLVQKYGDTLGYINRGINVVTVDLDIIRSIMSKNFNNFANRRTQILSNSALTKSVFFSEDEIWKRKRQLLTPNFSTAKLKAILRFANDKAQRMSDYIAQIAENKKLVPIKDVTGAFTAEIIAQTAFGCQIDCFNGGAQGEFVGYCNKLFKLPTKIRRLLLGLFLQQPWQQKLIMKILRVPYFDFVRESTMDYFKSLLKQAISQRLADMKAGKTVPMDFLQMLLNASDLTKDSAYGPSQQNRFTEEDIFGELVLIIFAGFETTATTLQFICWSLASHQDVQDKVLREIEDTVTGDIPTHHELSKLTYTKQVIDETLRLFPPGGLVERVACQDYKHGEVTIPASAIVVIPISLIHHDPRHWPNPDEFDPDRFLPGEQAKRHPFAFMPFGQGPRQCLGLRLAYLELKLALVHILRKVKFTLNDQTTPRAGESVKLRPVGLIAPKDPIQLAVEPR